MKVSTNILGSTIVCVVQLICNFQLTYGEPETYILALLGQRIQNGTDNTGMIQYELVLTNSGSNPATVNITDSRGEIFDVFDVSGGGGSETKIINEERILNGSEYSNKTLIVESNNPIVLEVFSTSGSGYIEGMLGIPIEKMNRTEDTMFKAYDYVVNTFCDTGGYCQVAVAALEDETVVSIDVPGHVEDIVFCKDRSYFRSKTSKVITLQKYDAIQIETTFDLTGTHIFSYKPIAVFAGSRSIQLEDVTAHTIEQLVPTWHWGTEFFARALGSNGYGDIVKITGSHANVTITMSGFSPFKLNNHYQVASRRLEVGMVSYIRATSPIQVMQITGLKYATNNTSEKLQLSMTSVPSLQNLNNYSNGHSCNEEYQVLYTGGADDTYAVKYTKYYMEQKAAANVVAGTDLLTVSKCRVTATMPASVLFDPSVNNNTDTLMPAELPGGICHDGGRSTVLFDTNAITAEPTRIELSTYPSHILKLRIQFCGNAVLQFFSASTDLSKSMLVRLSHEEIVSTYCGGGTPCTTKTYTDSKTFNNKAAINCETDMAYFWFWQNRTAESKPLCVGFGDEVNLITDCTADNVFDFSGESFTHVNVMGLLTDAKFNWDFQDPAGCGLFEEQWRCMDRFSNCSVYGTSVCSEPMYSAFVNKYCAKFCGKCTPDSYGRKFIVKVPFGNDIFQCYILVSAVNADTGVGVWKMSSGTGKVVPVIEHDKYARLYSCFGEIIVQSKYFKIISDDEVTVSVIYKSRPVFSYPVFPVDTFGLEYMVLGNDRPSASAVIPSKNCRFVSEYSDVQVLPHFTFSPALTETGFTNGVIRVLNLETDILKTNEGTSYSGSTFLFDKPVGVFCGSEYVPGVSNNFPDSNHVLPLHRWSTEYYIPAFDPLPPTLWIEAHLIITSNSDNTIVNIADGFDAIHAIYNRGDVISVEIDIASSYRVTSRENIAVGLLLFDDSNSSMSFHLIPPVSDMHPINVASLPNEILKNEFGFSDIGTITTYFANGSANSNIIKEDTDVDLFYRYQALNQTQFGFSIMTSIDGTWLVMPTPYKVISKTESVDQEICAISTDNFNTTNDGKDGDCDRLTDEEDCHISGYGIYRKDTDFDGGFGEDCKINSESEPLVESPIPPVCLIIDRPENQCWTPCKCKCSWVAKYEATKNMTEEELKDVLADETAEILNALQVDTVSLSSVADTKKSKDDERPSAVSIGYVGIAIFCVVFGAIIFLDFGSIIRDARILMGNLNDGYERVFGC